MPNPFEAISNHYNMVYPASYPSPIGMATPNLLNNAQGQTAIPAPTPVPEAPAPTPTAPVEIAVPPNQQSSNPNLQAASAAVMRQLGPNPNRAFTGIQGGDFQMAGGSIEDLIANMVGMSPVAIADAINRMFAGIR